MAGNEGVLVRPQQGRKRAHGTLEMDRTAWWWKPRTQRKAEADRSFVFRAFRYQEDSEVTKREKETSWVGRARAMRDGCFHLCCPAKGLV